MSSITKIAVIVCIILLIPVGYIFYSTALSTSTAERRGEAGEKEIVEADGRRRVDLQEEYFELCAGVQTKSEQIALQEDALEQSTDPDEQARLRSGILALQNTRTKLINEYNSKSANTETRGFLRDEDLPVRINPNDETVNCG